MKIAFFGAGLMGSGFVRRLRAQGHEVSVWNRSVEKARRLQDCGARACDDAAAALAGAARLHLSLADDASVDAVLEPLAGAIAPETWIVDHTTNAVHPTAERAARWRARGRSYVHAPVFMGPANAEEGTGLMLLTLTLTAVGLPLEGVALIAGIDRVLDMARTAVNVSGDILVSVLIARSENELDLATYHDEHAGEDIDVPLR